MSENVEIEIDLDDGIINDLIALYINENMDSASVDVFNANVENHGIYHASALAIRNQAILEGIKFGIEEDKKRKVKEEAETSTPE